MIRKKLLLEIESDIVKYIGLKVDKYGLTFIELKKLMFILDDHFIKAVINFKINENNLNN